MLADYNGPEPSESTLPFGISVESSGMFFNKESVSGLSPSPVRFNFFSYFMTIIRAAEILVNTFFGI